MVYSIHREEDGQWVEEQKLEGHSDWVRDVAWAPSIGLPRSIIASCGTVSAFEIGLHMIWNIWIGLCVYYVN